MDYTLSWPGYVAQAFDCEFGQIGVGSTGWIHPGQGGYPAMPEWWDHYSADQPRDLSLQPDYVWVALGANDHNVEPARLREVIQAWLIKASKSFPSAEIFLLVPFHGENRPAVTAAVNEAHDPRVHLIDLGHEIESAIPFKMGQATWLTTDGLHLRAVYHGLVAAGIARQSEAAQAAMLIQSDREALTAAERFHKDIRGLGSNLYPPIQQSIRPCLHSVTRRTRPTGEPDGARIPLLAPCCWSKK